jgi:hypothetical protein
MPTRFAMNATQVGFEHTTRDYMTEEIFLEESKA